MVVGRFLLLLQSPWSLSVFRPGSEWVCLLPSLWVYWTVSWLCLERLEPSIGPFQYSWGSDMCVSYLVPVQQNCCGLQLWQGLRSLQGPLEISGDAARSVFCLVSIPAGLLVVCGWERLGIEYRAPSASPGAQKGGSPAGSLCQKEYSLAAAGMGWSPVTGFFQNTVWSSLVGLSLGDPRLWLRRAIASSQATSWPTAGSEVSMSIIWCTSRVTSPGFFCVWCWWKTQNQGSVFCSRLLRGMELFPDLYLEPQLAT